MVINQGFIDIRTVKELEGSRRIAIGTSIDFLLNCSALETLLFWTATLALIASLDEDFGDSLEEDLSSLTLDD
uniref:hypothetical protein n=1 Tax=uncultured Fibrobacter sp. TaxID=261512 RepID=UPI0026046660|nr:hypothetical protein [uncultured Fibrobacter sp.]